MNIWYITDEVLLSSSVVSVHVDSLCKNFTKLGHTLTLFVPFAPELLKNFSYKIVRLKTPNFARSVFFQFKLFVYIIYIVKKNRPDFVYIRNSLMLGAPAIFCRLFKVPLILEANGKILDEAVEKNISKIGGLLLKTKILKFVESFNVNSSLKIIAVTEGIKNYFEKYYKINSTKIIVIPNGVDVDLFKPELTKHDPANPIVVGYIGSFYLWQGVQYMLEAAKKVLEKRSAVNFVIVGGGSEKEVLRKYVADNILNNSIDLRESVSHSDVPKLIQSFDICLCYPTRFRSGATSPFKVYEYMACGKAVVVADIGGMKEEFGVCVEYAEPESAAALSKKIILLIDNNELRNELGHAARKFVEKGKSWEEVARKILNFIDL